MPYFTAFLTLSLLLPAVPSRVDRCTFQRDPSAASRHRASVPPQSASEGNNRRPLLLILAAEDEYQTEKTLPQLAREQLSKDFRVSVVFADPNRRHHLPGLEQLKKADVLLVSVRRRPLESEQIAVIRQWVQAGKPVAGIRTASHAFARKGNEQLPAGVTEWSTFDRDVLGCHYENHFGTGQKPLITLDPQARTHPILGGVQLTAFSSEGSLYKSQPLEAQTQVLARGEIAGQAAEPVAWTFQRRDGGRTFYTSLGHPQDFKHPGFVRLLRNGVYWTAGLKVPD